MDKQQGKRGRRTRRKTESENTLWFTQNNTKNTKLENARSWWHTWILIQKFTSIHDRLVIEMNRCRQADVSEWMTKGKITLIQKDPLKQTAPNNFRTITCIPTMWKIRTAQIREEIYDSLTNHRLLPEEQKGCHKGSRNTGNCSTLINTSSMRGRGDGKI